MLETLDCSCKTEQGLASILVASSRLATSKFDVSWNVIEHLSYAQWPVFERRLNLTGMIIACIIKKC